MAEKRGIPTEIAISGRPVAAEKYSVGSKEYFSAYAVGLRPEAVYRIRTASYGGEDRITAENGVVLAVYRTYVKGDWIELYCERRAGVK